MRCFPSLIYSLMIFISLAGNLRAQSATSPTATPLRVGIVGLVHGHVQGFLDHSLHNPEIEIVGIAEPDHSLASQYATRYHLDSSLLFPDLEEMLARRQP